MKTMKTMSEAQVKSYLDTYTPINLRVSAVLNYMDRTINDEEAYREPYMRRMKALGETLGLVDVEYHPYDAAAPKLITLERNVHELVTNLRRDSAGVTDEVSLAWYAQQLREVAASVRAVTSLLELCVIDDDIDEIMDMLGELKWAASDHLDVQKVKRCLAEAKAHLIEAMGR